MIYDMIRLTGTGDTTWYATTFLSQFQLEVEEGDAN